MLAKDFFSEENAAEVREIILNRIQSDSSYRVISSALIGLTKGSDEDVKLALEKAAGFEKESSSTLLAQIA